MERLTMVKAWQQSGLSARAYCQQHHVNLCTLQYWRKQARQAASPGQPEASGPAFVSLKLARPSLQTPSAIFCELITPTGNRLVFHQSLDVHFLKTLMG